MHSRGGLAPRSHREDHGGRPDDDVPPGEYPLLARLPRLLVRQDVPPLVRVEARRRRGDQRIGAVPDGDDHRVHRKLVLRALHRDRTPPSRRVGLPQFHLLTLYRDHPRLVVAVIGDRVRQEVELDPLLLRVVDLLDPGGHLLLRAAVDEVHVLRPHPLRRARRVHRHVTAADDRDVRRLVQRGVGLGEPIRLHQVRTGQVLVRRVDPDKVLPRDVHEVRKSRARADEDGVEPLLLEQFVDGDRLADDRVAFQLRAQFPDVLHLGLHDLLWEAEFGDAVHEHPARLVQRFEDRHVVPDLDEVTRDGQPRGARPDHRDALARRLPDPGDLDVPGDALEVGDEPFETPDGHRLPLLPEDARHLALFLLGTDAAAHRGEGVGLLDFSSRLDEFSPRHKVDELGDLDADGAPLHALRVLALDAAGRLQYGEVRGQPERDLPEVPDPHLRRLLRHRLPGNAERLRAGSRSRVGHQFPPPARTAAPLMHFPSLCSIRSIAVFSSRRYARLRITSSLKSTWWPSNSGPSTQTNFVVPPTVTRQAPHIPVASTMIGLRLTMVLIPWGRVTSATARIIGTGPIPMHRPIFSPRSMNSCSAVVTNPFFAYDPSSVVTTISSETARISSSRIRRSFVRAPTIESSRFPAFLMAVAIGRRGAVPIPPPMPTTVPKFSIWVGSPRRPSTSR